MRRILPVGLALALVFVACKPVAKAAPVAASSDTTVTAVRPGDVCPPPDTAQTAAPTAVRPDTALPAKKAGLADTARKSAPPGRRETTAAKPKTDSIPPMAAALPRLWDFGSEKCIPCKFMYEVLTPMMKEFAGKVDIRIINVYEEQALSSQYRIQIIPTQVFMDASGKELYRHIGAYPRDSILHRFRELGLVPKQ